MLDFYNKHMAQQRMTAELFYQCTRCAIQKAIESAFKAERGKELIRNNLWTLCHKDFSVPSDLREWAMQEIEVILKRMSITVDQPPITPMSEENVEPPFFSKDTLYHASLCCHAVSTCTAGNFEAFFNSKCHLLQEVSMSISQDKDNVDRYIIATRDDTIYMAFQSEPTLSSWMDSPYVSFNEGNLNDISIHVPMSYFCNT